MPEADSSQRFMLGVSRGAMNTFMALRDAPEENATSYRAVAVIGGLVDLVEMKDFRPEMERVSVQLARTLSERLHTHVRSHNLKVFSGEDHMIRGERETDVAEIDSWFKQHLK